MALYKEPEYRDRVMEILEDKIMSGKKTTGRPGMDLWQIFVLAQYRLGLDLSYDQLTYRVNNDYTMRCYWAYRKMDLTQNVLNFATSIYWTMLVC